MNTKEIFIKRLKIAMKERKVNSVELSKLTEINKSVIDRILQGKTKNIRARRIVSFCLALQVSSNYLLGLSDEMEIKRYL